MPSHPCRSLSQACTFRLCPARRGTVVHPILVGLTESHDQRKRPDSTALGRRSLIRMRSQVQVLAGPPTISAAHGHPRRSPALALPAALPGSCHPRATASGGPVLRTCRRGLDQLIQGSRDGSVPASHDVLIAQGGGRGGMAHPHHQLTGAGARRDRQGGRSMAQVMKAEPFHAGRSGSWDQGRPCGRPPAAAVLAPAVARRLPGNRPHPSRSGVLSPRWRSRRSLNVGSGHASSCSARACSSMAGALASWPERTPLPALRSSRS